MGVVGGHGVGHRGEAGVVLAGGRGPVGGAVSGLGWVCGGEGRGRGGQRVVVVRGGRHTVRVGVVGVLSANIHILLSFNRDYKPTTTSLSPLTEL